jgi:hypothetical protein
MIVEGSNFPPPAPPDRLALLRQVLPSEIPSDYIEFISRSDGGQIWFNKVGPSSFDCLRIYSVSRMLELRDSFAKLFPWLLVIGGDQGSQYLGYDTSGNAPWPIVMFLPGWGATKVAVSFTELAERYFLKAGDTVTS